MHLLRPPTPQKKCSESKEYAKYFEKFLKGLTTFPNYFSFRTQIFFSSSNHQFWSFLDQNIWIYVKITLHKIMALADASAKNSSFLLSCSEKSSFSLAITHCIEPLFTVFFKSHVTWRRRKKLFISFGPGTNASVNLSYIWLSLKICNAILQWIPENLTERHFYALHLKKCCQLFFILA